jgi:hypothetical protein
MGTVPPQTERERTGCGERPVTIPRIGNEMFQLS